MEQLAVLAPFEGLGSSVQSELSFESVMKGRVHCCSRLPRQEEPRNQALLKNAFSCTRVLAVPLP